MLDHGEAKVLITDTEFRADGREGAGRLGQQAARRRRRRPAGPRRQATRRASTTRRSSPAATRTSRGSIRPTSGTRSRSTTPRAPPATPRVWSTTIAAPTSTRCPTSSPGACRGTRCTCGRCRCSTATAGASRGRWPPIAGTNVCLRTRRGEADLRRHPRSTRSRHYCGAPIVHSMLINAPGRSDAPGSTTRSTALVAARAAARRGDRGHGADGLRHHPRLRPDRDLRPRRRLRASTTQWDALAIWTSAHRRNGRQGVRYTVEEGMTVMDPETMSRCPGTARPWARSCSAATS